MITRVASPFKSILSEITNAGVATTIFSAHVEFKYETFEKGSGNALWPTRSVALKKAQGEAIERFAFYLKRRPAFKNKSFHELRAKKFNVIDPSTISFFSPSQWALKERFARNLTRGSKIDWGWAEDATNSERPILIPFGFLVGTNSPGIPLYFEPTTNGNACGNDPISAKVSGILELLERDAFLFYWRTNNTPAQVSIQGDEPRLQQLRNKYSPLLDKFEFFHLRTDIRVPVILALFRNYGNQAGPRFVVSAAANLDPIKALEKAICENLQGQNLMRKNGVEALNAQAVKDYERTVWNFDDRVRLYANGSLREAYSFFFRKNQPSVSIGNLLAFKPESSQAALDFLLSELKTNGIRVYFRDISPKKIIAKNMSVYRVFSPDLIPLDAIHMFRAIGLKRYFELPRKLSLGSRPVKVSKLNPFPHPFP